MKTLNFVGLALALVFACSIAVASAETKTETTRAAFKQVPTAEVPARAAQLVGQARVEDLDRVTTEVIRVAVKAHPNIAPAIVGAVAKQSPAAAITAAATASKLQPKQVTAIARAAAVAAPSHAGGIVKALCKLVPNAYRQMALAVAEVAPDATDEILAGLSAGLPAPFKAGLDAAIASYKGQGLPSVAAVLDQTPNMDDSTLRGPTIGGPYVVPSGTPTNAPPAFPVPPGGRDYARP